MSPLYPSRRHDSSHLINDFIIPCIVVHTSTGFQRIGSPQSLIQREIRVFWLKWVDRSWSWYSLPLVCISNSTPVVLCESTFNRPLCPYHSPRGVWLRDFSNSAIMHHEAVRFGLYPDICVTYRRRYKWDRRPNALPFGDRRFDGLTWSKLTRLKTVDVSINHTTWVRRANLDCPSQSQACAFSQSFPPRPFGWRSTGKTYGDGLP